MPQISEYTKCPAIQLVTRPILDIKTTCLTSDTLVSDSVAFEHSLVALYSAK